MSYGKWKWSEDEVKLTKKDKQKRVYPEQKETLRIVYIEIKIITAIKWNWNRNELELTSFYIIYQTNNRAH